MFIGYGIVATVFLLIGFWIGIKSRREKRPPPCISCTHLIRYMKHPGLNCRYKCDNGGAFDRAPDICGRYNKKENIE